MISEALARPSGGLQFFDDQLPVHGPECTVFRTSLQGHSVTGFRSNSQVIDWTENMDDADEPKTVGERVRVAREAAGLKVRELAERVGMRPSTFYDLERGDSKSTTKLAAIAKECGESAYYLETGKRERSSARTLIEAIRKADSDGVDDSVFVKLLRMLPRLAGGTIDVVDHRPETGSAQRQIEVFGPDAEEKFKNIKPEVKHAVRRTSTGIRGKHKGR